MLLGVILLFQSQAIAHAAAPTPDLDREIVNLYSQGRCPELMQKVPLQTETLRPNIMAIVASCSPAIQDSISLFKKAEAKDPHGDLIATLYAMRLDNEGEVEAAQTQWIRVMMYARNESLRNMAREALSGIHPKRGPLNLSKWTWSIEAETGAHDDSAPWFNENPATLPGSAVGADVDLFLRSQYWLDSGSISGVYRLQSVTYPSTNGVSFQDHYFEVPYALRVGPSEDLVFRPFADVLKVGGLIFSNEAGLGFSGVAYREHHKQTVTGFVANEHNYISNLLSPTLTHYHFDYQWEWFLPRWMLLLDFGADHYEGTTIRQYYNVQGHFDQTHNDLSLRYAVRRGFDRFSLGLELNARMRLDAQDTTYVNPVSQQSLIDRRDDYLIELEPHIIWRALPRLEFRAYGKRSWAMSSVGAQDYGVDFSHNETIYGLILRTFWSSY